MDSLGSVAQQQGDLNAARVLYQASLHLRREMGDKQGVAQSLSSFAMLAVAQGEAKRSARLLAAAEALYEALGTPLAPDERAANLSKIAVMRASLGEEGFAAAWAEGQAMTMEQAIEYALEEAQV